MIVPTAVNGEVARAQKEYEGKSFETTIKRERMFSFRWHPFAVEEGVDYSAEAMTLVVFAMTEV